MDLVVRSCVECPFLDSESFNCNHPKIEARGEMPRRVPLADVQEGGPPEWCDLVGEDVVVKMDLDNLYHKGGA